jgi:hypothetical protein
LATREKRKQDSSFSEEKEAKRLLFLGQLRVVACIATYVKLRKNKVFLLLFLQKKKNP